MWDDEERRWLRWRIVSILMSVVVFLPFVLLVLASPLPIAWFFEGGRASIQVSHNGPQSEGRVDSLVHTAGLSDTCGAAMPGSMIVFVEDPRVSNGRVAALSLIPSAGGLAVTPMDLPETLAQWSEDASPVTARLALAQDPMAALLPAPVREGMYWRIQGSVAYAADLREALAIAPMSVATESPALLAARTQSVARDAQVEIGIDVRWLASRRGPVGLPLYCW